MARWPERGRRVFVAVAVPVLLAVLRGEAVALQGTLVTPVTFIGPVTGQPISFSLYLPPGYAGSSARYPVVYHLHGMGGAHNNPNQLNTVSQSHEDAVAAGRMGPVLIVFPDGDTDSFWADSMDGSRPIETQVVREIVPYVDAHYRTRARRTWRAIQGFSMGGFGAAKFAAKFPRLFSSAVVYDGALVTWAVLQQYHPAIAAAMFGNDETYFNGYSPWHWVPANAAALKASLPFRQVVGTQVGANQSFHSLLLAQGVTSEYLETGCIHTLNCVIGAGGADSWAFIAQAFGASGLWTDEASAPAAPGRALRLDVTALREHLREAPMEGASGEPVVLALPLPGGGFARFEVVEAPILEPALQERFREIRTYRGQGRDDRSASVRLDLTPRGFHAMILSSQGTTLIDPLVEGDTSRYVVRAKREAAPPGERFRCLTGDRDRLAPPSPVEAPAALPLGDTLRTFRFALAGDGEYTARVCLPAPPGIPCALAQMATGVNRVTGILEREVAARLVLIANEPVIIYTDPATDPYTNGDPAAMREENQANLDAVIGSPNYDIGHAFGTGGGGIAVIGGVCLAAHKGRAATGRPDPIGDPFYVDYVAHEIGHHIGANHSFNGTTLFCNGNRFAPTAWEPGSGSTIMSYSGLCDIENVQIDSDDYYYVGSQIEISNFLTGVGALCTANTPTGNTIPTVSAGPDWVIPKSTPFTLTASAADPDGDALTIAWEEMDLGAAGPPNTDNGNRPIFRTYKPDPSPSRTFPRLDYILNFDNTPPTIPVSESLPTTSRSMQFRATVRDNRSGGGGVASDVMVANVYSGAGPFKVTVPDSGLTWNQGSTQLVAWNVANTDVPPVSCTVVDIRLSTDGGLSFPIVLAAGTPNDGSEAIVVPSVTTGTARVKVACAGVPFFDISNSNFSIVVPVELQGFSVE